MRNKVAGLGQHNLLAQLPSCLVHPLLLSSSNYLLHEAFCLIRYEASSSYSETISLLPVEKGAMVGRTLTAFLSSQSSSSLEDNPIPVFYQSLLALKVQPFCSFSA